MLIKKIISLIFLCLLLVGCGFHLRSAQDFPPQLRTLNLKTPNPYSSFTTSLTDLLTSMNVQLTKNAPYTLNISQIEFNNPQAAITTTTQAVTYTYTLTITYSIEKHSKVIVAPQTLTTSQSVMMNVNQIYNSNSSALTQRELEHTMMDLLYNQFISDNVRMALEKS